MLINFTDLVKKYGRPKGVIHLGSHLAEELPEYISNNIDNVVWIEANPMLFKELKKKISNTNHIAISELLSDKDDIELKFNIAKNHYNGNYQSSSVLDFGLHETYHPHKMEGSIELKTKTLRRIFLENDLKLEDYNFINMDLQGYELTSLRGFGDGISKMDFIYSEVNTGEVYKNCTKLDELDEYLTSFGFQRVETEMTQYEWGDAFYIKNK